MWDRLLKNARVVDPVNGRDGVMDVAVKDGRIAAVGPNLQGEASEVEDLTGLVVMPGLIDPHLHLGSMFGSAYGTRMAAAAGVTTCLDMAGPVDEILETSKTCGAGINVAMLEGFSPMKHCGTMTPTREQLEKFVRESLEKGAVGVKIMGGHWPLPLETSRELVKTANDMNAYVAWHAGSHTSSACARSSRPPRASACTSPTSTLTAAAASIPSTKSRRKPSRCCAPTRTSGAKPT